MIKRWTDVLTILRYCIIYVYYIKGTKKHQLKRQEAVETNRRIAGHKPNWSQVTFILFPKKNRSVRHYQRQYPCHS